MVFIYYFLLDGFSYELEAIKIWLEDHIRSPMTGTTLENKILLPNINLKAQIEQWTERKTINLCE